MMDNKMDFMAQSKLIPAVGEKAYHTFKREYFNK
jgi:hypothetical protein